MKNRIFSRDTEGKRFWLVTITLVLAALLAANSIVNIVAAERIYPTPELLNAFLPNDWINLFFGGALLVSAAVLLLKRKRIGFAFLAAVLLFVLYNEIALLFVVNDPFGMVMGILIMTLSTASMLVMLFSLKQSSQPTEMTTVRHPYGYGAILIAMGVIFIGRAIMNTVQISNNGEGSGAQAELGVALADMLLCPVWVFGGIMMMRKSASGSMWGLVSYLNGSMLFLALLIFMAIQPIITGLAFAVVDFAVIVGMSLLIFIPTALLMKRTLKSRA